MDNAYQSYSTQPFLFEDLPIPCPRMPAPNSNLRAAANEFMQGRRLDHIDFMGVYGSWRLAVYVHQLKKLGWPVERTMTNGIAIYFISLENIAAINKASRDG